MASIFRKDDQHVEKPKRNVYNKTFQMNLTTRFGQLMPVFCKPVMNGESVKLKHKHNFNFLPLVFPVQTRVRASLQYFYVRNRNVWKNWEDFQFKMKPNLVKPYLKFTRPMRKNLLRLGGVLDNLGVPVVAYSNAFVNVEFPSEEEVYKGNKYQVYDPIVGGLVNEGVGYRFGNSIASENVQYLPWNTESLYTFTEENNEIMPIVPLSQSVPLTEDDENRTISMYLESDLTSLDFIALLVRKSTTAIETLVTSEDVNRGSGAQRVNTRRPSDASTRPGTSNTGLRGDTIGSRQNTEQRTSISTTTTRLGHVDEYGVLTLPLSMATIDGNMYKWDIYNLGVVEVIGVIKTEDYDTTHLAIVDNPINHPERGIALENMHNSSLPYANDINDNEKTIRLDAMPSRHIESIYNAFYRNAENNPYKIDGVNEYNKYIHTLEGGADSFNYPQRYANWQDDAYTTALHTPQHGDAPLVGLVNQNVSNDVYVTFANDDGTKSRVRFVTAPNQTNPGNARNLIFVDALPVNNDFNVPGAVSDGYVGQLQEAMLEATKFGITINDFRNVNSFQRWLENNVRKGYKYRDQIKAHYGVSVRYDTLDMPEYLGGTSRDMTVNQVTQTVENENGVLGDYAGQAFISGASDHSINHYCDEEGFIIGILSIMPSASYSQVLSKFWTREQALDYYSPEFGKIGMQPILNRELDPIGSYYAENGDKIFGYQRPWHDYLDSVDTVHGLFRTVFRNFILNRTFDDVPKLSEDFLTYHPDQLNNIFYVDDDSDKILGQILFEYSSRVPIPLYGIPALE